MVRPLQPGLLPVLDRSRYLERIRCEGAVVADLESLRRLQRQHLLHVPFENLDIHTNRLLSLETIALFAKLVERRRGGFCYELNSLFAWLLAELGFEVHVLSARVVGSDGRPGPEFDHMTLLVQLEQRWLVDVGFGESFREPLRLDSRQPQTDGHASHRVVRRRRATFTLERQASNPAWIPQYVFTLQSRRRDEFEPMCVHHQTSPDSHFTRKRLCTLATPEGRITLSDLSFTETARGERTDLTVTDETEWKRILSERFGIEG